jgi:hypothetical protein
MNRLPQSDDPHLTGASVGWFGGIIFYLLMAGAPIGLALYPLIKHLWH